MTKKLVYCTTLLVVNPPCMIISVVYSILRLFTLICGNMRAMKSRSITLYLTHKMCVNDVWKSCYKTHNQMF